MKSKLAIAVALISIVSNATFAQKKRLTFIRQEQSIALSTGVNLKFMESGTSDGMPVIFLHGLSDSWHSFEKILPMLPTTLHAYAISQRGHGNSDKQASGYLPKDFAADVAAFVKQKHLGKVVVVGHSMGGMVAQQFAIDYPQLIKGLILIDTDASFGDNIVVQDFLKQTLSLENIDRKFMEDFQNSTLANNIDPEYFETVVNEGMKTPVPVFKAALLGVMDVDLTSRLKEIQVPVLILWGEKDLICSIQDQYLLARHLKKSNFITYKQTGHALHWEQPEKFVHDLLTFVKGL